MIFFKTIKIGSQFEYKLNLNNFKDSEKFYLFQCFRKY